MWRKAAQRCVHWSWASSKKAATSSYNVSIFRRSLTCCSLGFQSCSMSGVRLHQISMMQCAATRGTMKLPGNMQCVATPIRRGLSSAHSEEESDDSSAGGGSSGKHVGPRVELNCSGCGATLQTLDPSVAGFIPRTKLEDYLSTIEANADKHTQVQETISQAKHTGRSPLHAASETKREVETEKVAAKDFQPVICQRCFSLKHYNTALNITLKADDYIHHLSHLKDKRALILLMIDVVDFPGSLFPNLSSLIPPTSLVFIVANKIDLLPEHGGSARKKLEAIIVKESMQLSLDSCKISKVHFISAKTGEGVESLTESILKYWGNRGDVYLLGCTNVGKSSLFNSLLTTLCGARPGELTASSTGNAPSATISRWPGTTLGLLSFPIMSMGKRQRLLAQARKRKATLADRIGDWKDVYTVSKDIGIDDIISDQQDVKQPVKRAFSETEDVLVEIGLKKAAHKDVDMEVEVVQQLPQDRFRLYDTPGAINDAQLINLLTTKELNLALPKKAIKPRTFILKPGMSMLIGGLARLDYTEGSHSAYFTVFAASYLSVHVTKVINADSVYERNLGTHLLKIPCGTEERIQDFPRLEPRCLAILGEGWKRSAADIVLSSAGWVGITGGMGEELALRAFTPLGKGIFVRQQPFFPTAVNDRGVRSRIGNKTAFSGRKKTKTKEKRDRTRYLPTQRN